MKKWFWAAALPGLLFLRGALPLHANQAAAPKGVLAVVKVFEEHRSPSPEILQFETEVPPFGVEHQVRLSLDARIESRDLAGSNPWMIVKVNGSLVDVSTLLNKADTFYMRNGVELTWYQASKKAWRVLYSPDFELALKSNSPAALIDTEPYRFVWDITPLVRPGKNVIEITHLPILQDGSRMVLRDGQIEVGKAISPPASEMVPPAPTGPLPSFAPQRAPRLRLKVEGAPGEIRITAGEQTVAVGTRTSLPEGAWWKRALACTLRQNPSSNALSWQTPEYSVQRKIEVQGHRVAVSDTFTNLTDAMIGVLVEHSLLTPSETSPVHLAGHIARANPFRIDSGSNPSVFVQRENGGAALLAEGDVFRAHAVMLRDEERAALADHNLGIGPRASVTLQWAIYPLPRGPYPSGDYWDFANAVRSDWQTNFAIPGPFAFMDARPGKSVPEVKQILGSRGLEIICGSIAKYPDGKYAHGTGILFAPEFVQKEKEWIEKVHQAAPGVKAVCYFHAQISTEPDATTKYAADRDHDTGGKAMSYPYQYDLPMFIPTEKNQYGKALWGYVKAITETIGADGLYWDEMSHSVNEYATDAPWDNCSAQIDPTTHRVIKPLTNVPLLMQPLHLQILEYLRRNNRFIMANTQAQTQTMTNQRIVRFVETNTYSALPEAQLECPLGLGNHHPEDTPGEVAKHVREMLKRGCYYYGHYYYREAPKWDFLPLLYPMTPQKLGPGFIIGKERIATATSGHFAFADGARAEIYEVDEDGAQVTKPGVREHRKSGKFSYEIRIPGDHFVILVRR